MKNRLLSLTIASGLFILLYTEQVYAIPDPPVSPSIIILNGYDSNQPSLADSIFTMFRAIPALENKVAIANYKTDIGSVYPSARLIIAQLRGMSWRGNDNGDTLKQQLTKAYTSGISILVYGDTYLQSANALGDSYFEEKYGVRISFMDVQEKITYLNPGYQINEFAIVGIGLDELGRTLPTRLANVEKTVIDNPSFMRFTSAIGSIGTSSSTIIPFLFYDKNPENIAGVRMISAYDSRAVFLSFRIESIADQTLRSDFISRIVNWLDGSPTSVADEPNNTMLSIIPNPASATVRVSAPREEHFEAFYVTDIFGNRVLSVDSMVSGSEMTINTSLLATGVYRVVCVCGSKKMSTQLVVQH